MKSKLPLGKRGRSKSDELDEIDEEESDSSRNADRTDATDISGLDEETQNNSLLGKLQAKLQSMRKGKQKDSYEDEIEESDEVDTEAAKKKKRSKIIQITIIVAVILFVLSDYIIPPEEPTPPAETAVKPGYKKRVKPIAAPPANDAPKADPTTASTTDTPITPEAPASGTETLPDSPVTVTSEDTPAEAPVTEPAITEPVITDTPTEDPTPADISEDLPATVDTPTETLPEDISLGGPSDSNATVDTVDGGETTMPAGDDNLTDQILQDLEKQAKTTTPSKQKKEYVSPPDYEYRGRGLVYNCQGKHWACIDAPSYKTCEDNASSVNYLKKKTECYPFNVYETLRGCESMQNRMVSSSAKTTFCND